MGVFGLQTMVGQHWDSKPGSPACESGVVHFSSIKNRKKSFYLLSPLHPQLPGPEERFFLLHFIPDC